MGHPGTSRADCRLPLAPWERRSRIARGGLVRWTYGPEGDESRVTGQDAAVVADGRILAIYAFLGNNPDPVPVVPEATSSRGKTPQYPGGAL